MGIKKVEGSSDPESLKGKGSDLPFPSFLNADVPCISMLTFGMEGNSVRATIQACAFCECISMCIPNGSNHRVLCEGRQRLRSNLLFGFFLVLAFNRVLFVYGPRRSHARVSSVPVPTLSVPMDELDDAAAAVADQLDTLERENRARWFEADEERLRAEAIEIDLKAIESEIPQFQLTVLRARQDGDAVETTR